MNQDQERILDLLEQEIITADEANRLLAFLQEETDNLANSKLAETTAGTNTPKVSVAPEEQKIVNDTKDSYEPNSTKKPIKEYSETSTESTDDGVGGFEECKHSTESSDIKDGDSSHEFTDESAKNATTTKSDNENLADAEVVGESVTGTKDAVYPEGTSKEVPVGETNQVNTETESEKTDMPVNGWEEKQIPKLHLDGIFGTDYIDDILDRAVNTAGAVVEKALKGAAGVAEAVTGSFEKSETYETNSEEVFEEAYHGESRYEESTIPQIRGFEIQWTSGSVTMELTKTTEMRITETSNRELRDDEKLEVTNQNGILRIRWMRKDKLFGFGHSWTLRKDLHIELPESMSDVLERVRCNAVSAGIYISGVGADEIALDSTSGSIRLEGASYHSTKLNTVSGHIEMSMITTDKLTVNSISGKILCESLSAEKAKMETVSGKLTVSGKSKNINASSVSGALDMEFTECPDHLKGETVSGKLIVAIPENEGFRVKYGTFSGKVHFDFPVVGSTGKSGTALYKAGGADFNLETMSGGIAIYKRT